MATVTCTKCQGSGVVPDGGQNNTCPVCNGTGKVDR